MWSHSWTTQAEALAQVTQAIAALAATRSRVAGIHGAVEDGSTDRFMCAYATFVGPLVNTDFFGVRAAIYLPFLISGWINIVFLAAVAIRWRSGNGRAFRIMRITTLLMIPFCWMVFYHEHAYPREGHFL